MAEIILPTQVRKATAIDPGSILIYGSPKCGKTTIAAQLPNSLLLELEHEGADHVDANVIDIRNPMQFEDTLTAIQKANNPYTYLIIDTVTKLDK